MKNTICQRLLSVLLITLLAGCVAAPPPKPVFQPLSLDLSGDLTPRDPSLPLAHDVYCVIGHGTALIAGQWAPYQQTGFILPGTGVMSSVMIEKTKGSGQAVMRGYYDDLGQKMVFCPVRQGPPDAVIECQSLYAMSEDLTFGIKRTFDVPEAVLSGHIACAYDQAAVPPL